MALFAKMIILFVALFVGVYGQDGAPSTDDGAAPPGNWAGPGGPGLDGAPALDDGAIPPGSGGPPTSFCRPLELPRGFSSRSSVFFDSFTAQGVMEGIVAVQGDAVLSDISIGSQVADGFPAFMVAGNLDFRCGSLHGNLFYGGTSRVGPRVDNDGYTLDKTVIASIYDHLFAFEHYSLMSKEVFEVQSSLVGGMSSVQGTVLRLVGGDRPTEVFKVSCSDLNAAKSVWFQQITNTLQHPITIIINIVSDNADQICKMDFSRIDGYIGLDFSDKGSHIIWNFPTAVTIELHQTVLGSILAPLADIQAYDAVVEGQIIANSLNGSIFGILEEFTGCLPTDPCHVLREDCVGTAVKPSVCIEGELVVDVERGCCEVWECKESCEDKSFPCETIEDITCIGTSIPAISHRAGSLLGSDPCCDSYQCVSPSCADCEQPLLISCPNDRLITKPVGSDPSAGEYYSIDSGVFLFADPADIISTLHVWNEDIGWETTACNGFPNCVLFEGLYLQISRAAPDGVDPVLCAYEIKVRPDPTSSGGCRSGGVDYDEGQEARNECNRICICVDGQLAHCARERPELQTMSLASRQLYFQTFKTVYNQANGVLKGMVDNHVQFFSRGLHNSGTFLPWHRGYLLQLENLLIDVDCRVTLPRWNWMLHPRVQSAVFWGDEAHQASGNGDSRDRCLKSGNFGEDSFLMTNNRCLQRRFSGASTTTNARLASGLMSGRYLEVSNFDDFRNRLEHGPGMHDSVHCIVGGTMCSARSSNDPVFWSHHANIDWIWSTWQKQSNAHKLEYSGTTSIDVLMPTSSFTPRMMLDMNSLDGHIIIYAVLDVTTSLTQLLNSMTPEERSLIGNVEVGAAGKEWLDAMDLSEVDQNSIHEMEAIANRGIIHEALSMTLQNGLERGLQMPDLEVATAEFIKRLTLTTDFEFLQSFAMMEGRERVREAYLFEIFIQLQAMFVAQNIVPRFVELQDILFEFINDDGTTSGFETVTISVPVGCVNGHPVCAQGVNFPNECVASDRGFVVDSDGLCPLPSPPPMSVSPDVDGGASADYNHQQQELAECPENQPTHSTSCDINHVVCYYGASCCSSLLTYEITTTCNDGLWFVVDYQWDGDCNKALCGSEKAESRATVPPPTDQPTRSPTAATRTPTRSPTPPPTLPRAIPQNRQRTPVSSGTVSRPARASEPVRNNRPTRVVSFPTSSTTRPVIVSIPTQPITNTPCATVTCLPPPICCESGSSVAEHIVGGCSQCYTCISDSSGLPTVVPACCSAPPICPVLDCASGTVANVISSAGPDGTTPCCPRYQCQCPACPTLADANCIEGRVPRFASLLLDEVTVDSTGCRECRVIRCVVDFCPNNDIGRGCGPGQEIVFKNPASIPACQWFACQEVCPNPTETRSCPAPGGGTVEQFRHMVPHQVNGELVCPWDPCPEYEPCDDSSRRDRLCNGNGRCQRGHTNRIVCECNSDYNGEFCDNLATPPRTTYNIFTRSFLYASGLVSKAFMCYPSATGRGCYVAFADSNFKNWLLVPGAHTILGFEETNSNAYWATDEGFLMVTPFVALTIDLDSTRMGNEADEFAVTRDSFLDATFDTFSYRKVVNNELPPPREYSYVINSDVPLDGPGDQDCIWWVYLTEESVVFYHACNGLDIMVKTSWFEDSAGNNFLTATETELCEDLCSNVKCEDPTTTATTGVCDRTTGVCMCYFGFYGKYCTSTNSADAITK